MKRPAIVSSDGKQLILTKPGPQGQFMILYRDKDLTVELSCIHYAEPEGGRPADRIEVWLSTSARRAGIDPEGKPLLNGQVQQEIQELLKVAIPLWDDLKRYLNAQQVSIGFT